jgi:hypothetical protein
MPIFIQKPVLNKGVTGVFKSFKICSAMNVYHRQRLILNNPAPFTMYGKCFDFSEKALLGFPATAYTRLFVVHTLHSRDEIRLSANA